MRILFVEDDQVLGRAIKDHVVADGHSVDWMQRLDDARLALKTTAYELILLDLGLPDGLGLHFLKEIRMQQNNVPVIIATAQDQIDIRIEGLNAGADDYLVKPFDLFELSARLNAVARRYTGSANPIAQIGDVSVDLSRKLVEQGGKTVKLSAREWSVLERLVRNRGAIVNKSDIENSLYEFGAEIESNAVEVYISRLRKKIGSELIQTIRGIGYQIEKNES